MNNSFECHLCPRECGVDRGRGETGVCGCGALPFAVRAAAHYGEEPCISGSRGSGAVFFAGCPLHCVYCQNAAISGTGNPCGGGINGAFVTPESLSEIILRLAGSGVHNINFVTPTPHTLTIIRALDIAAKRGFSLPVVWNCGGYESVGTLRMLDGYVSVYMPDVKYMLPETARRYSSAEDYPERVLPALREMYRQTGPYDIGDDGLLRRGLLVRHLVLPGESGNTRAVIDTLAAFHPGGILVSLMGQYTPLGDIAARFPSLANPLSDTEYGEAAAYLADSDIHYGYTQQPDASGAGAIPAFDGSGIISGQDE